VLKQQRGSSGGDEEDNGGKTFSSLQVAMYPALARYADTLITCESRQNRNEINNLLSLHILNHVLTSRSRVQRHNRRIKELANGGSTKGDEKEEEGGDKWRDQGYTRPKVLILLPTRGSAWTFIQQMLQCLGESAIVDNSDRFDEEYGPLDPNAAGEDSEDEEDDEAKKKRRAAVLKQKGYEWNELFADEINSDDDFKMGLSLTPNVVKKSDGDSKGKKSKKSAKHSGGASGVHVKLFADYYHSDIILASPIGLKMTITGDDEDGSGDEAEAGVDKDFLSSIDICLVGRSDVLLMQNWDHVNTILESINQQPTKIADIDFSRVRNYFLEGQAVNWRQLIVVSQFTDPYILSTFRRHAKNIEGQCKIRQKVSNDDASICDVMVRTRQVFQRVVCTSISEAGSNRLRYFSEHVLPKLMRLQQKHTLIYIPSYFDFIAVRNLLLKKEASFVSVTEYARVSEVSRGRARFLQGRKSIMLYTGRAHFFLRHKIKGARHVIFFGLPEYAEFYPDVVNMLNEGLSEGSIEDGDEDATRMPMSCLSLFTKFDAHQLERIVGTSHTERMIRGEKSSFMFCS
jgi:U3 small nucleolar RNA-associated protein 25